jgi:hypothetical protein
MTCRNERGVWLSYFVQKRRKVKGFDARIIQFCRSLTTVARCNEQMWRMRMWEADIIVARV